MAEPDTPVPSASPDDLPLIDPRAIRASNTARIDIGNGQAVVARKADLAALLFEGAIPLPMLNATQNLVAGLDGVSKLSDQDRNGMLTMFRQHACRVVIQPRIVMVDDGDPDHLPVELLEMSQLMAIWEKTTVASPVSAAAARRFRSRTPSTDVSPAQAGTDIQPSTEQLDSQPTGTGQVEVEYA